MILKRGAVGEAVSKLIEDLTKLGYAPDGLPGANFNADVAKAVMAFQSENNGPNQIPLVLDGEVGPLTQWAIDVALVRRQAPPLPARSATLPDSAPKAGSKTGWNALQVAKQELANGAGEQGGNNSGPDVMRYHGVTGTPAGASWCASFVAYCFKTGNGGTMPYQATAGARDTLAKFKAKGWGFNASVNNPPAAGDIIVWYRGPRNGWMGHIGIVSDYRDGIVYTIEGNRGPYPSKVSAFSYTLGQIDKLLGFGRAVP
jgi:hypothetical protein